MLLSGLGTNGLKPGQELLGTLALRMTHLHDSIPNARDFERHRPVERSRASVRTTAPPMLRIASARRPPCTRASRDSYLPGPSRCLRRGPSRCLRRGPSRCLRRGPSPRFGPCTGRAISRAKSPCALPTHPPIQPCVRAVLPVLVRPLLFALCSYQLEKGAFHGLVAQRDQPTV